MKKSVFKYFDTFCYGELIPDEKEDNWVKPFIEYNAFGYSINDNYLFYNGGLLDDIERMFSVGRVDFKEYLREWFKDRYDLPVRVVL
jgi:hypothetical protein